MKIAAIGVAGAGQMGAGISQVAAQAGFDVVMYDVTSDLCQAGLNRIAGSLEGAVKRGKLTERERRELLARITTTTSLGQFERADFVIEAVVEAEEPKVGIFRKLQQICRPEVIFASNTSSISITKMGALSGRPDRFVGMHFMNPAPVMKLVELVRGLATSEETWQQARALAERMGKTTLASQDSPGFIVNRLLLPMINEAIYALYEGVGQVTDIDLAMKLGTNHPMGPLELADLVGLDTCLAILSVMHRVLGDDKYRPCPLLIKYVDAGYLGRKAGRGFYIYDREGGKAAA